MQNELEKISVLQTNSYKLSSQIPFTINIVISTGALCYFIALKKRWITIDLRKRLF
jgi:hypothetical protein